MSNTTSTINPTSASTRALADCTPLECECRARADAFVAELIGAPTEELTWDEVHPLQGHVHIGRRELVVIATHDTSRRPVVLTVAGWDAVRRSSSEERRALIASCAITNHSALVSVLESDAAEWLASGVGIAA